MTLSWKLSPCKRIVSIGSIIIVCNGPDLVALDEGARERSASQYCGAGEAVRGNVLVANVKVGDGANSSIGSQGRPQENEPNRKLEAHDEVY